MRLAIHGYGRMGRIVDRVAGERGHDIAVVFDLDNPIRATALHSVEALIDFSHADAIERVVAACCEAKINLISGTTGWQDRSEEFEARCRAAGIGFVHTSNFSPGATIVFVLARHAAALANLFGGYAAGIEERHHVQKKDSPSGTAIRIATEVREGSDGALDPQIAALRVGVEYGVHTLCLDSAEDVIEITHRARNRDGFARGAVIAAEKLAGKTGIFRFEELVVEE